MHTAPASIRILKEQGVLEITWNEEAPVLLPFHFVRCHCPCAGCVNELTGERMLQVASIPQDIHPVGAELCGNYALRIAWSDRHDTGIYTWTHLRELASLITRV